VDNSGLVALSVVCAGVVYHKALEVDCHLSECLLVLVQDCLSKVRDVDSCVALPCQVQLVVLESGKLLVEFQQCLQIILGGSLIRIGVIPEALAEADLK
jgi:hypothetical protein